MGEKKRDPVTSPVLARAREHVQRTVEDPRRSLLLIVGVALLLRVFSFAELSSGPCEVQHRWAESDMAYFDAWAHRIASGDLLSRDVGVPMHGWHRDVANEWLSTHPAEAAELGTTPDPQAALWRRWTGGARFYQDPLYVYLVAITYWVSGADPGHVFAWQLALGVAICAFVHLLARRLFGPVAGAIAGLVAALYAPLVYYEHLLLREVTIVFAALGLVLLILRALDTGRWGWWGAFGVACGLAYALKGTFLLESAGLAGGAALVAWRRRLLTWRHLAAGAVGLALGLAPLVARNLAVGVEPLAVASSGPLTFVSMNAEDYPAEQGGFAVSRHAARILGESGGEFLPAALATLRTHPSAASWLGQLWTKLATTLNWFEIPNNANFYYYRLHSAVLRWLPGTFFLVAPLGLVGLALARRREGAWPMFVLLVASVVPLLAFMTMSRLRLPLAIALIPFAAHAIAEIGRWLRSGERGDLARGAGAVVASLLLLAWTGGGAPEEMDRLRPTDFLVATGNYYVPEALAAARAGDWRRASAVLGDLVRTEPEVLGQLGPGRSPRNAWEQVLGSSFAAAREDYARALRAAGDAAAAEAQFRRAAELWAVIPR